MSEIDQQGMTGTIAGPKPHERFLEYVGRRAETEGQTIGAAVSQDQLDRILTAETDEEIWDADEGGTVSGKDCEDVELRIFSFILSPSSDEYDAPLGVYALIKAQRLDTGEELTINTGSDKIIAKLRMFESRGSLPIDAVIRGQKTPKGRMLKLRPVPKRAVPAETA
jgi:hypothetical protein